MLNRIVVACWLSLGALVSFNIGLAQAQNAATFPSGGGGASLGGPTTTLGPADAASPTAQTLNVQSVAAGTSNTAGADFAIAGSKGTGTGAGGGINLQVALKGTTGTSQNALSTAARFGGDGVIYFPTSGSSGTAADLGVDQSFIIPYTQGLAIGRSQVQAKGSVYVGTSNGGPNNNNGIVELLSDGVFAWASSNVTLAQGGPLQTILSSPAAATFQFGGADVAAPVAQTLQVQSVVAGTSNTAGTNATFNGSAGTGTGAGGNIVLQTAPAGTTGTAQNALVQAMVIDSKSHIRVGAQTAPALTSCGTSPAIVGDDTAATVTMGTSTPTGCVITFKQAYASAPICTVTWRATPLASQSYAVSTTAITLTQTATNSNVVDYICRAQNGG